MYQYPFSKHFLFYFSSFSCRPCHTVTKHSFLVFQSILPLLPLVSLSGALKGYLYGIQKPIQAGATQIWEEIARLFFLYIAFALCPHLNAIHMASIAMLSISVGEAASCFYMILSLHISFKKNHKSFTPDKTIKKKRIHFCFSNFTTYDMQSPDRFFM